MLPVEAKGIQGNSTKLCYNARSVRQQSRLTHLPSSYDSIDRVPPRRWWVKEGVKSKTDMAVRRGEDGLESGSKLWSYTSPIATEYVTTQTNNEIPNSWRITFSHAKSQEGPNTTMGSGRQALDKFKLFKKPQGQEVDKCSNYAVIMHPNAQ